MHLIFSNNARSTLAGAITNVSTTAVLAAGTGALMPQPIVGQQYFKLSFTDAATGAEHEIVHVTQIIGDTITMVRAQEGTAARPWLAGDKAEHLCTAGSMATMVQLDQLLTSAGQYVTDFGTANQIVINLSPVPTAAADFLGAPIRVKKAGAANTGATTVIVNGVFGPYNLINPNFNVLASAQLVASTLLTMVFDGTQFMLQSITGPPDPVPLTVPLGGTGVTAFNSNAVLLGNGTGPISWANPSATLPLVGTGGAPAFAPLDLDASTPGGGSANVSGMLPVPHAPVSIIAVYPTPGANNFTVLSHMWWVYCEVLGGGGGGAGYNTDSNFSGGGGGGGGYAAGWCDVTPGQVIVATVGAGGAGGTAGAGGASGCNGGDGGPSSFGAFASATGGSGGIASLISAAGGQGGLGTIGAGLQIRGGYGAIGDVINSGAPGLAAFGGHGGSSFFGGGIYSPENGAVPASPAAVGSGGGGGYGGAGVVSDCDGTVGMPGIIIVRG